MRAVERAATSSYGKDARCLVLADNLSVVLVFERSRARDFKLLSLVRRESAWALARGLRLRFRWIPSELNNSDKASRKFEQQCDGNEHLSETLSKLSCCKMMFNAWKTCEREKTAARSHSGSSSDIEVHAGGGVVLRDAADRAAESGMARRSVAQAQGCSTGPSSWATDVGGATSVPAGAAATLPSAGEEALSGAYLGPARALRLAEALGLSERACGRLGGGRRVSRTGALPATSGSRPQCRRQVRRARVRRLRDLERRRAGRCGAKKGHPGRETGGLQAAEGAGRGVDGGAVRVAAGGREPSEQEHPVGVREEPGGVPGALRPGPGQGNRRGGGRREHKLHEPLLHGGLSRLEGRAPWQL